MTTDNIIAANGRRLLDALAAWPSAPDNGAVLAACDQVKAAADPASAVVRAECELADAVETAVDLGNSAVAWAAVRDAMRKSNTTIKQATRLAFEQELAKLTLDNLNAEHVDALAEVGRALRAGQG